MRFQYPRENGARAEKPPPTTLALCLFNSRRRGTCYGSTCEHNGRRVRRPPAYSPALFSFSDPVCAARVFPSCPLPRVAHSLRPCSQCPQPGMLTDKRVAYADRKKTLSRKGKGFSYPCWLNAVLYYFFTTSNSSVFSPSLPAENVTVALPLLPVVFIHTPL